MTAPLVTPRFEHRQQRAWRMSIYASLTLHLTLAVTTLFLLLRADWPDTPAMPSPRRLSALRPEAEIPPALEMTELAPPDPAPEAPATLDPSLYRSRLDLTVDEQTARDPKARQQDLQALKKQAAHISDQSLDAIGLFLGRKPGEYKARTHYKNELNRNADFSQSHIVAASTYPAAEGPPGYSFTLRDQEGDEFIFTLEGSAASPLRDRSHTFAGTPLGTARGEPFEWKDARIEDIKRWKRPEDRVGMRGARVVFLDPTGQRLELTLAGERYKPFVMEMRRFIMKRLNLKIDGSTLHTDGFDHASSTLEPMQESDIWHKDGVLHVRSTLIDRRGERLVTILTGARAEEYLQDTKVLRDPALQRIYEATFKHMLPEKLNDSLQPDAPSGTD